MGPGSPPPFYEPSGPHNKDLEKLINLYDKYSDSEEKRSILEIEAQKTLKALNDKDISCAEKLIKAYKENSDHDENSLCKL